MHRYALGYLLWLFGWWVGAQVRGFLGAWVHEWVGFRSVTLSVGQLVGDRKRFAHNHVVDALVLMLFILLALLLLRLRLEL